MHTARAGQLAINGFLHFERANFELFRRVLRYLLISGVCKDGYTSNADWIYWID
jgi:hypothetical protein